MKLNKHTLLIISAIYMFSLTRSQLSNCRKPENLLDFQYFELASGYKFVLSDFITKGKPKVKDLDENGYYYAYRGNNYVTLSLALLDKQSNKDVVLHLKISYYNNSATKKQINTELTLLNELSRTNPLSAPIYLSLPMTHQIKLFLC